MKRSFRFHASNYAWAEIAGTLAGLLSFPILTRLLSVADYGAMNLVASVLGLTVALGKLGVQHAALRTWAEVQAGHSPYTPEVFRSTVFWGMTLSGCVVMLLWTALAGWLPSEWWGAPGMLEVMLVSAPLIGIRVLDSLLINQLRAEEASQAMAVYSTMRRYLSLIIVVAVLYFVSRSLTGFYLATLGVEAAAISALMIWRFRRSGWPRWRRVSWPLYGSLAAFGLPMLGSELSTVVLTMSDRFIIQMHLDAAALGVYAASYNMCDHLRNALLGAMVGAAYPRCLHLWETQGRVGLQRFLESFLHGYVLVAGYMIVLMTVVGGDLMAVLASAKYAQGGVVTGWIMAGLSLQTVLTVAAIGIYLSKRTLLAMGLVLTAGILSIAANTLLVPIFGIRGAGISVFGVFLLLVLVQMGFARRVAPVVLPWRAIGVGLVAGIFAVWIARGLQAGGSWMNLLTQGAALTASYLATVVALDMPTRQRVLAAWRARRAV
jgi:O-antigen/teichoic acid export membrane protein